MEDDLVLDQRLYLRAPCRAMAVLLAIPEVEMEQEVPLWRTRASRISRVKAAELGARVIETYPPVQSIADEIPRGGDAPSEAAAGASNCNCRAGQMSEGCWIRARGGTGKPDYLKRASNASLPVRPEVGTRGRRTSARAACSRSRRTWSAGTTTILAPAGAASAIAGFAVSGFVPGFDLGVL